MLSNNEGREWWKDCRGNYSKSNKKIKRKCELKIS